MKLLEHARQQQAKQVLLSLRLLAALRGHATLADLKRYLCLSLQAEILRQRGFTARVCGRQQHWLIAIEGGKTLASGLRPRASSLDRVKRELHHTTEKFRLARKQAARYQSDVPSELRMPRPVSFSWPFWL